MLDERDFALVVPDHVVAVHTVAVGLEVIGTFDPLEPARREQRVAYGFRFRRFGLFDGVLQQENGTVRASRVEVRLEAAESARIRAGIRQESGSGLAIRGRICSTRRPAVMA